MLRERAMHPYEMQRVMHQRHTDELLALKRGSLYHAINQLQRDGLIEPVETTREGRRPERTVYQITPDGDDELALWMRELLSMPVREASQFTAALAFLLHLPPEDALEQLELRAVGLDASIAALHAIERGIGAYVGRVSVLELEYQRAVAQAELDWVRSIIGDIRSHRLTWNIEDFKSRVVNPYIDMNNIEASQA
jgi:DNA-binding PadR family transcriptional regulator